MMEYSATIRREQCIELDRCDPLAQFRQRFVLPDGEIYLDGNSLGALPKATIDAMRDVVEQRWGQELIRGWNSAGWVDLPQHLGDRIGQLLGARPGETLVADSTSVNLFKLLATAVRLRPGRHVIVSEKGNFPTDLYIAQGLTEWLGNDLELRTVETAELIDAIDDDTAVVSLSHVNFADGYMHDMAALTRHAHRHGALILWDLAHSAGVVPISLAEHNVDFAVGCGYKYLNGGPGAPSFLYVAERLHAQASNPITGWFGHAHPFDFTQQYQASPGISKLLAGTPPILSMTALASGVDVALEAPMAAVRKKSLALGQLMRDLIARRLPNAGFECITPHNDQSRGSQISLRHQHAWPISQALIDQDVIGDFRTPDILRLGFAPLYVRYVDVWDAVDRLCRIMRDGAWQQARFQQRNAVT